MCQIGVSFKVTFDGELLGLLGGLEDESVSSHERPYPVYTVSALSPSQNRGCLYYCSH